MNKKFYAVAILSCGLFFFANAAENLLKDGNPSNEKANWNTFTVKPGAGKQGGACFEQTNRYSTNKELIPMDIAKTYKLSASVKNPTDKEVNVLLGVQFYDKDKCKIKVEEVSFEAGTDTELAADCLSTDTVLKVKDATKWKFKEDLHHFMAFNTRKDCGDLPNRNISPDITKIEKKDDYWEITLKGPAAYAFPAGTPIRQHKLISPPYACNEKVAGGADWREVGGNPFEKLYPKTAYCALIIVVQGGTGLLFDNIKFETLE